MIRDAPHETPIELLLNTDPLLIPAVRDLNELGFYVHRSGIGLSGMHVDRQGKTRRLISLGHIWFECESDQKQRMSRSEMKEIRAVLEKYGISVIKFDSVICTVYFNPMGKPDYSHWIDGTFWEFKDRP